MPSVRWKLLGKEGRTGMGRLSRVSLSRAPVSDGMSDSSEESASATAASAARRAAFGVAYPTMMDASRTAALRKVAAGVGGKGVAAGGAAGLRFAGSSPGCGSSSASVGSLEIM